MNKGTVPIHRLNFEKMQKVWDVLGWKIKLVLNSGLKPAKKF